MSAPAEARGFVRLDRAVRSKTGWLLLVRFQREDKRIVPQIVVQPPGEGVASYSRNVRKGESYDACAQVVLDALVSGGTLARQD